VTKEWTDETIMPWGKHKGTSLEDVPSDYLLWVNNQEWIASWPELQAYIKKNIDQLREEAGEEEDAKGDVEGSFGTYEDFQKDFHGF
jgi:hypothetical protein